MATETGCTGYVLHPPTILSLCIVFPLQSAGRPLVSVRRPAFTLYVVYQQKNVNSVYCGLLRPCAGYRNNPAFRKSPRNF